jgi:hypothetical protein
MKHLLIILGAFALITGIAILNLRFLSGPEDAWLCQGGAWVRHGRPTALAPDAQFCTVKKISRAAQNQNSAPAASASADQIMSEIKLTKPVANEIIFSPFSIEGKALGNWFFEASFPIKLIDENGKVLARGTVTANPPAGGDWMTADFVPFKATLNFNPGSSTIGMLILTNDNPSGLPENEKQYGIPVRFSKLEKITVKAYFGNTDLNPQAMDCGLVYPAERLINKTQTTARAALEELLAGPTDREKMQGYYTSINPGVKINSLIVSNGAAKVDFDEQMDFQMGGSCRVTAIRAQITQTLKQFPAVKDVIISVNGNSEAVLQP